MEESKRMSFNETKELILLKHDLQRTGEFKRNEGNPHKLKNIWKNIAEQLRDMFPGSSFTGVGVRTKYNQLLSKYKSERTMANKSGAEASNWVYWDIFHDSIPENMKYYMENVPELGFGEELISNKTEEHEIHQKNMKKIKSEDSIKSEIKKSDLLEIKLEAHRSIISSNRRAEQKENFVNLSSFETLKKDVDELKLELKENKEGIKSILEILKKWKD